MYKQVYILEYLKDQMRWLNDGNEIKNTYSYF